jgi:hypothetical protein
MTFREALHGGDEEIRRRLEALMDSEDAVIVLAGHDGITSYAHGFGISGCQAEMLGQELESAIRLAGGIGRRTADSCERRAS